MGIILQTQKVEALVKFEEKDYVNQNV